MAIKAVATKNNLAARFGTLATHGTVYTTAPGTAAGTEPAGMARKPITWGAPVDGVITSQPVVFDIPAGTTVKGTGMHDALSGGNYIDGKTEADTTFTTADTLTVTFTYAQV